MTVPTGGLPGSTNTGSGPFSVARTDLCRFRHIQTGEGDDSEFGLEALGRQAQVDAPTMGATPALLMSIPAAQRYFTGNEPLPFAPTPEPHHSARRTSDADG